MSGTSALKAVKLFLLSLMQPVQDFFMSVIILQTPGMKNLDCMWLRVWRTSHFGVCIPHNTLSQDGFLADLGHSNSGSKTAIRDMRNTIQGLDDEVLEFVGGDDGLRCSGKTKERMEALTELQMATGLGFCLRVLQLLWMKVRAVFTLERLWLCSRRLVTRSEDRFAGMAVMRLMVLDGILFRGRDTQFLVGQDDLG